MGHCQGHEKCFFHLIPAISAVAVLSLLALHQHMNVGFSPPRAVHRAPWASAGTFGVWLTLHMGKVNCNVSVLAQGFLAPKFPKFLQTPQFWLRLWVYDLQQTEFRRATSKLNHELFEYQVVTAFTSLPVWYSAGHQPPASPRPEVPCLFWFANFLSFSIQICFKERDECLWLWTVKSYVPLQKTSLQWRHW